jgi:hypothetical protein
MNPGAANTALNKKMGCTAFYAFLDKKKCTAGLSTHFEVISMRL